MKIPFAAGLPLLVAACTALPELDTAPALTAPALQTPVGAAHAGPTVDYTARSITEPGDWRQLNDAQAPGGGS